MFNFSINNIELNDFRIIICLRKSEVTVERISVCNDTEKLAYHNNSKYWDTQTSFRSCP